MRKLPLFVVISVAASLLLTACGPPGARDIHYSSDLQKYPSLVRKNTLENYDEFKKQTWIIGPSFGKIGEYQFLRALSDSNNSVSFIQLYVYRNELGNRGYDFHSTYDLSGNKLDFVKIKHETDWTEQSYWYEGEIQRDIYQYTVDEAAITLRYKDLVQVRKSGLRVKVYGKRADKVIDIPGVYIDDFLSVLEERYNLKRLK